MACSGSALIPSIRMYSRVIFWFFFEFQTRSAPKSSPTGNLRFTGMILSRVSSSGPWSEIASRICWGNSASFLIWGTKPDVDTVMRRAPILSPQSEVIISRARQRFLKLARGSPIPMNTRLFTFSPDSSSAKIIWETISAAERLRVKPSSPEAQNLQP